MGEEPSGTGVIDREVARHVQQRRWCGPAHSGDEQITVDRRTVVERDGLDCLLGAISRDDVAALASIDDASDVDAGPFEVEQCGVALRICREHDGAGARFHGIQVDQTANSR